MRHHYISNVLTRTQSWYGGIGFTTTYKNSLLDHKVGRVLRNGIYTCSEAAGIDDEDGEGISLPDLAMELLVSDHQLRRKVLPGSLLRLYVYVDHKALTLSFMKSSDLVTALKPFLSVYSTSMVMFIQCEDKRWMKVALCGLWTWH